MSRLYLKWRVIALVIMFLVGAAIQAAFGGQPYRDPLPSTHDHFDRFEVNHFHNEYGYPVFDQVICYDWIPSERKFKVNYWFLLKKSRKKTKNGEAAHNAEIDRLTEGMSAIAAIAFRNNARYIGEFVGSSKTPKNTGSRYEVRYLDGSVMRLITADFCFDTYTIHDPERDNKDVFPENSRRGLTQPGKEEASIELLP